MKKSACIEMIFTEAPFYERFKLAREAGFEYVEFWSWDDKDLDKIKDLCNKYNLKIGSFSGDKAFSMVDERENADYIDFIKKSIKAAKFLECDNLVIHSNALGEGGIVINDYKEIDHKVKYDNMRMLLNELKAFAEENEVTLVLEALNIIVDHVGNFLAYTEDSANLIKAVNSPYIKILYDVYHMQINEGNVIDNIKKHINEIGYIHVADAPGRHEPGTGELNYNNIFKSLRELEYKGIIGFELEPINSSKNAIDVILAL
ncbi:TIM barrel protein [Anaeromicrobium sediminis]|uniref:AP endonuclease n=1 Tax=Anaeromicrobium sediminis TaxID=1478221 RepID=A0A267MHS7_9FIRM|nr:TIM barrel protein [Anaeromicrobium sediminis]PAB58962.1 AP endonuclease [Anaeromicrobium sediminis]